MNKNIITAIIAIMVLGGGIYYYTNSDSQVAVKTASDGHTGHTDAGEKKTDNTMTGMDHSAMNMSGPGSFEAGTRVIVNNQTLKPGVQDFSFKLYGKDGDAWEDKDLKEAHTKKMHLIVVSNDFSDYQHVHPTFTDGNWKVALNLKDKTSYLAYVDVDSNEIGAEILRLPLTVGMAINVSKVTQNEKTLTKNNITTNISGAEKLVSGKENTITFKLTNSGKSITPEMYLGAKGHVVALSSDPNIFIHGHPNEDADMDEVHFAFTFTKEGTYTLFAQFQVNGKVETYPFTVNVGKGNGSTTADLESSPHAH